MNRKERRAQGFKGGPRPLRGVTPIVKYQPGMQIPAGSMVITNLDLGDDTFTGEIEGRFLTFNVTRAQRDCNAGHHGKPYVFEVDTVFEANRNVEVENAKVEAFMQRYDIVMLPLLTVIIHGRAWLVEGHHRLNAMKRLGIVDFLSYVIEEDRIDRYMLRFNGQLDTPSNMHDLKTKGRAP